MRRGEAPTPSRAQQPPPPARRRRGAVDREQRTPSTGRREGRAAARHRADHGEGGRQRDGLGAARAAPLGVPMDAHECAGALLAASDPVGPGPRPAHAAPLGGGQTALKCLTLLLGQTGISVRAPRPSPPPPPPSAPRAPRRRPAAPRPSRPTAHPLLLPPCQVDAVDWGGFSALHCAARRLARCIGSREGADRRLVALGGSRSTWPPSRREKLLQDDAPASAAALPVERQLDRTRGRLPRRFYAPPPPPSRRPR